MFFIYLTNWALLFLLLRVASSALSAFTGNPEPEFLIHVSNGLSVVVSGSFWILLYEEGKYDGRFWVNHFEHTFPVS